MTEEEKKAAEAAKLNWGEGAKTTYTEEEVAAMKKDMESNSEKWVQKVITEKKNYQSAMWEISKVAENKEHLIDLYDSNPEVAQIILDQVYDWQDIDAFKEAIWYKEDYTDPKMINKLAEQKAKAMIDSDKIATAKTEFIKKLQMEWDELQKFEEAFSERMEMKSFNANDIVKHLEKAYREGNDDPDMLAKLKNQEIIGKSLATWWGKWWGSGWDKKETSMDKKIKEVQAFKEKYKTS